MTDKQKMAYDWAKSQKYTSVAARYAKELADLVDDLKAAIRAQQENERNDPLTLDELRQMVGQPVWVTHRDGSGGRWGIVNMYHNDLCADVRSCMAYWFKDYIGTIAYRRKPDKRTVGVQFGHKEGVKT